MANKRRRKKNDDKVDKGANFWAANADDDLGGLAGSVRPSDDPTALVRSLGQPPLPGQNRVSGAYFDAVYLKAAHFATALATANDLIDSGDDTADDAADHDEALAAS